MKNKRVWYDTHVGKVISTFSDSRNIVQHGDWGKTQYRFRVVRNTAKPD